MCDVRPSRHYNTRIGLQTAHKKEDGEWIKKALFRGSNQETLAVGCTRPKIVSVRGRHWNQAQPLLWQWRVAIWVFPSLVVVTAVINYTVKMILKKESNESMSGFKEVRLEEASDSNKQNGWYISVVQLIIMKTNKRKKPLIVFWW